MRPRDLPNFKAMAAQAWDVVRHVDALDLVEDQLVELFRKAYEIGSTPLPGDWVEVCQDVTPEFLGRKGMVVAMSLDITAVRLLGEHMTREFESHQVKLPGAAAQRMRTRLEPRSPEWLAGYEVGYADGESSAAADREIASDT
jgi:hypothetical protein